MKAAPIIHTRTYSCDFNSEFLVRPEAFMEEDIKWARKNVLGSTGEIDGLKGFRWMIADCEEYRLAGVVGFLKDIHEKCQGENETETTENLFCDNKGRLVYAFVGIVIDKEASEDYSVPTLDYLWKMYVGNIEPIWKRNRQESILKPFKEVDLERGTKEIKKKPVLIGSKRLYESNLLMDYTLFSYLLSDKQKESFTFCSNIADYNLLKQCEYSIVTTSGSNITRMQKSAPQTEEATPVQKPIKAIQNEIQKDNLEETPSGKKKPIRVFVICLMIFLIILLLAMSTGHSAGKSSAKDSSMGKPLSYRMEPVDLL